MDLDPAFNELSESILGAPLDGPATRHCIERLDSVRGRTVVEMGCGEGALSVLFALHGAQVVGFDVRAEALERARGLAHRWGVEERCHFMRCASEHIAIDDASTDLVFSRSTLQYSDRGRALAEATRILEPGGTIALIENLRHHPLINLYRLARRVRETTSAPPPGFRIRGHLSIAEVERLLDAFPDLTHDEFELLRVIPLGLELGFGSRDWITRLEGVASRVDGAILRFVPVARRIAWFTVVWGHKRAGAGAPGNLRG